MTPTPDKPDGEALKACPHCGSADIDPEGWASTDSKGPACNDCGASAGCISQSLADNIGAWNTRTPPPVAMDEVARVIAGLRSASFHLEVMDRGPELPHIAEIQKAIALLTRIKDSSK